MSETEILPWKRLVLEATAIVASILLAFAIDAWWDDRQDRKEESAVLKRLLVDLDYDARILKSLATAPDGKIERLRRIQNVFRTGEYPANPRQFLEDIVRGARMGWNQPTAQTNTIDELRSSGNLGIIRSQELRDVIAKYYKGFESMTLRALARESDFPAISFQLVPRVDIKEDFGSPRLGSDESMSDQEVELVVENVMASPLLNHVTAEINLAIFVQAAGTATRSTNEKLRVAIESYQDALGD